MTVGRAVHYTATTPLTDLRPATCAHSSEVASMVEVLGGCISGKLFKLLNLRSPRDCGSCRPLYSNHATDRPATCAHSSEVASMVADFYGAIQVLRNGGGGCLIFWKKALRRCNVHIAPHEGVGGGPISRKKSVT